MALTYNIDLKDAIAIATRNTCANGTLELQSAGDVALAIFGLSADGGTVSTGSAKWTLVFDAATVTGEAAAGTGTAATKAVIKKASTGSVLISGLTVGVGSGDINLNNNNIASGQSVNITSATITRG